MHCRAYRGLYIVNWIYRSFTEDNYRQWIGKQLHCCLLDFAGLEASGSERVMPFGLVFPFKTHAMCTEVWAAVVTASLLCAAVWISGLIQTGLYADFFYYYFKSWQNNEKLSLPT